MARVLGAGFAKETDWGGLKTRATASIVRKKDLLWNGKLYEDSWLLAEQALGT